MWVQNSYHSALLATGQVREQLDNGGQIDGKLLCRGGGFKVGRPWAEMPGLLPASCMALSSSFFPSEPLLSPLERKGHTSQVSWEY